MVWLRRRSEPMADRTVHRGRIFYSHRTGWWRYACRDCNFGAGSRSEGPWVWEWLMRSANDHANPEHWSRNRGRRS